MGKRRRGGRKLIKENMNVFWKHKDKPSLDYSEKENNITHAFLVAVQNEPKFLAAVLRKVGIKTHMESNYNVIFQVNEKERYKTREAENKYILFISSKYNEAESESNEEKGSIPDGLVFDTKTSILIESKVASPKDDGQIKRYKNTFYNGAGDVKKISWEDICSLARQFAGERKSSVGCFLLDHFHKYLEVANMAGFDGVPFFKDGESYDKETAVLVIKRLGIDLKEQLWFKEHAFVLGDRKKATLAWDYFCNEDIIETYPTRFPHYSVYVFPEFFGVDIVFHRKDLKKILREEQLREKFLSELEKIAKSPDYYISVEDYHLISNKRKGTGVQQGPIYFSMEFRLQLSHFIRQNGNVWRDKLTQYLEMLQKEESKQISIIKKALYTDKEYKMLDSGEKSLEFIKDTVTETKILYDLTVDLQKREIK